MFIKGSRQCHGVFQKCQLETVDKTELCNWSLGVLATGIRALIANKDGKCGVCFVVLQFLRNRLCTEEGLTT